jgi:hypothetical protein
VLFGPTVGRSVPRRYWRVLPTFGKSSVFPTAKTKQRKRDTCPPKADQRGSTPTTSDRRPAPMACSLSRASQRPEGEAPLQNPAANHQPTQTPLPFLLGTIAARSFCRGCCHCPHLIDTVYSIQHSSLQRREDPAKNIPFQAASRAARLIRPPTQGSHSHPLPHPRGTPAARARQPTSVLQARRNAET